MNHHGLQGCRLIVAPQFHDDDNKRVMRIQHASYSDTIVKWVDRLIVRGHQYKASLNAQTEIGTLLAHLERFDHRTIQDVHDHIAAAFRFRMAPSLPLFDCQGDKVYWEEEKRLGALTFFTAGPQPKAAG